MQQEQIFTVTVTNPRHEIHLLAYRPDAFRYYTERYRRCQERGRRFPFQRESARFWRACIVLAKRICIEPARSNKKGTALTFDVRVQDIDPKTYPNDPESTSIVENVASIFFDRCSTKATIDSLASSSQEQLINHLGEGILQ